MEREVQRMTDKTLAVLRAASIDVEGTLARFCGNSALYEKFLVKFLQDDNFEKIGEAIRASDSQMMQMAAHTLKGVSGNLGFTDLMAACAEMVSQLRQTNMEGALAAYPRVRETYETVCEAINSMEGIGG
ncbi:Hpt domain-containing protein [Hungatella effluvii]|uniref:Hpt domain-containing protein n=1 Tax=Hungatella effluvii TaxID=1096246 RepID=A0A2V3YBQ0_9FIRM|nr:Hpt domain-containing protein [Hungatella effluvii]PXX54360.1 Hpt domain-containing protein [Hungatella effluvii]